MAIVSSGGLYSGFDLRNNRTGISFRSSLLQRFAILCCSHHPVIVLSLDLFAHF